MQKDPGSPGLLRRLFRAFDTGTPAGMIRGLMMFFLTVYLYEGMVDPDGLSKQTLNYYLSKGLGWPADQAANYVLILLVPWVIKPLYGAISDFFPIFGYRRKSYLVLVNFATSAACFWLSTLSDPAQLIIPLFIISLGTAASSALCQAVMVESGKLTGLTGKFVSQQWLWFSVAGMIVLPLGGFLSDHFGPLTGLHAAAVIMGIPPICVILASIFFVREEKQKISVAQFWATLKGLGRTFASRTLWLVAGFIALWYFSPAFGMSLYYFQTRELGFSQQFIGILGMIGMVGAIIGSVLYMFYLRHPRTSRAAVWLCRVTGLTLLVNLIGRSLAAVSTVLSGPCERFFRMFGLEKRNPGIWMKTTLTPFFENYAHELEEMSVMKALIYISLFCGVSVQLSYVFLSGFNSAIVLAVLNSIPAQIAMLTSLTLAARACPDKAEGFTYAAIMSIYNVSIQMSSNIGASWYEHVFNHHLAPLALISAGCTALCFLLVPLLPREALAVEDKDTPES